MQTLMTFVSAADQCQYLHDRDWQFEYEIVATATADEYGERLRLGWRRFGHALFKPSCPACSMCRSLRIPVVTFHADRSQKRAWKANDGVLRLVVGAPSDTSEKRALFEAFHSYQHDSKGWSNAATDYTEMFVLNPFKTEEWCYYLDDRLIAVGYVDRVDDGLSAIYFYYDPRERHRSLGTFNVLSIVNAARAAPLPYVYLGYYVEGCRSLEYKARFRPHERLEHGRWTLAP